jgi:sulfatase modifying factor 1
MLDVELRKGEILEQFTIHCSQFTVSLCKTHEILLFLHKSKTLYLMIDKILEPLLKILPFAAWLQQIGVNKELAIALASALNIFLVWAIATLIKKIYHKYRDQKTADDIPPFTYNDVRNKRRYYIPTKGQNISPSYEDETGGGNKFIVKKSLIDFFLKEAFLQHKEDDKFYLILADSGMGKTTFMINLYLRYHAFWNFNKKYNMKLLPFGDKDILERIKQIKPEESRNTILLLDAFDEYRGLLPPEHPDGLTDDERFRKCLDEIVELTRDFREVIITSRTQYFPGQEDKPYELKIPSFDEKGFHILVKLYISPFNDAEIRHYLNKKFGIIRFWNYKKKRIAADIVKKSPRLMVRPMLLSYIDFLVDGNSDVGNPFQIYETLTGKWIEREAKKRKHESTSREQFKQDLRDYSRLVALEIYQRRKDGGELVLPKEEAIAVARQHNINLQDYEITGQSLLTRDAAGNWKFAHKSIFEYYIAREAATDMAFLQELDFTGLDMARLFYNEVGAWEYIRGGAFLMGSPENEIDRREDETQHPVRVSGFFMMKYPVTLGEFEKFMEETGYITDADKSGGSALWDGKKWNYKPGVNWRCDAKGHIQPDKKHPVIHVSWNDATAFCEWLSAKGKGAYRLPTEAEWEYACRAGTATPFNTGENLTTRQANYNGNFPHAKFPKGKFLNRTTQVGAYPPNAYGLYDMHGNVHEWCSDWYDEHYYKTCAAGGEIADPAGPAASEALKYRVVRGGSWDRGARYCRSAYRGHAHPAGRRARIGFRLVFVP